MRKNRVERTKNFRKEVLRCMQGSIRTFKIASYDIETDTSDNMNNFLFGGFIDGHGKYKCFKDKDKMIAYMERHVDSNTMVFATNNAFDHYALFGHREDFLKEPPIMRGSLLINAKYHNISTYDTRAFSKAKLEDLGRIIGKHKGKAKFEHFNKEILKNRYNYWLGREYNKRDCEITREFMIGLQKVMNDLGGILKVTIGSCAMDLFKRKFLKKDIQHEYQDIFPDGERLKEFLARAYHGGRTEIFHRSTTRVVEGQFYYYDFNSLYPSVMTYEYPKPSSCHLSQNVKGKLSQTPIEKYEGCSECEVFVPYMDYPMLPMMINHKLCFPIGRFRGVFTHIELRKLLEKGGKIIKIYKSATYTKKFSPFKEWVETLYSLRLKYASDNNDVYKEILKLLMNNLYGKFFQRNVNNIEFMNLKDRNDDDLSQDGFTFDRNIGFGYRETPKESNQTFIIPIFAVYTTAYGRMKLYDKLVELEGFYCDTDSILCDRLINTSKNLGDLKLEFESDKIQPVKPKEYKLYDTTHQKWIYKAKGVRMHGDKETMFDDIVNKRPIEQKRFSTIKESIRSGGKFRPNEVRIVMKTFDIKDDKRVWIDEKDSYGMQISVPFIIGFENIRQLQKYGQQFD